MKRTKNTITRHLVIAMLVSCSCYSQFSAYFPVATNHVVKAPVEFPYVEGEGGNSGVVLSYDKGIMVYSAGVIRNSFGLTSKLAFIGVKKRLQNVDFILSAGVADGYDIPKQYRGRFISDKGIAPLVLLSLKKEVYKKIGVQLNISPLYINYGIFINI